MLDGAKKHFVFGYMRLPMNGDACTECGDL